MVKAEVCSSLGEGYFHVRVPPAVSGDVPIVKYRLQPQFSPLPLRIR